MRSHEEPKYFSKTNAPSAPPAHERREATRRHPRTPGASNPEDWALHARHAELTQEHRDLDNLILLLLEARILDQSMVARFKKRKLHLKDELSRIESEASYDLPV